MDLQSSVSIYDQIRQLCKQDKMDAIVEENDADKIHGFHQEFKIKEPTVWNPNYLATLLFL
jgi:hypothetical protein